ncbi:MAG TPA: GntR family transcriptional regulator [Devosiaceae bacterium]|nr:GntR family transcriptional regulator [Devosiaceae bacterium]
MQNGPLLEQLRRDVESADTTMPLYKRLKQALEVQIASGALKPGHGLPGERVLAEGLSLSRVTVRKSIEALVEDGLVRRSHGSRTEIASHVEKSLSTLTSFTEDMTSRGFRPGCVWVSKDIARPSPAEMMALGVATSQQVVRLQRIRTADDAPVAIETSTVPTRFLPSPALVVDSLYETLNQLGAMPQRAIQRMRPRPASERDSTLLRCEEGAPLLIVERRCFLADEQIVEFSETRYRGDVYDFVLELRR